MKEFIKVKAVMSTPGNPQSPMLIRVSHIDTVSEAPSEAARIGAAGCIGSHQGAIFVTESFDEIVALLGEALR